MDSDLGNGSVDARNGLFCVRSGIGGRGYLGRCDNALNISSITPSSVCAVVVAPVTISRALR